MAIVPFFILFYLLGMLVTLLEHTVNCFPLTVVTSDKAVAEQAAAFGTCSAVIETEKFMIENSIFSDVDLPPVRDIYLVMSEGDYERSKEISRIPDAIVEMNPFLKQVADLYLAGKLKLFAASFVIGIVTAVLTFPVALPLRTPFRRLDRAVAAFGASLFFFCFGAGLFVVPGSFRGVYLLTVGVGLVFVLVFRLIVKRYEQVEGSKGNGSSNSL